MTRRVLVIFATAAVCGCHSGLEHASVEAEYARQPTEHSAADPALAEKLGRLTDFDELCLLRDGLLQRGPSTPEKSWLAAHADDTAFVGLTNFADLFIPARLDSGHMKFQGHGVWCDHDLFTVGGRAKWLLRAVETDNGPDQWSSASGPGQLRRPATQRTPGQ